MGRPRGLITPSRAHLRHVHFGLDDDFGSGAFIRRSVRFPLLFRPYRGCCPLLRDESDDLRQASNSEVSTWLLEFMS